MSHARYLGLSWIMGWVGALAVVFRQAKDLALAAITDDVLPVASTVQRPSPVLESGIGAPGERAQVRPAMILTAAKKGKNTKAKARIIAAAEHKQSRQHRHPGTDNLR